MGLVEELIKQKFLKTESIIKAFREIKRQDFLPDEEKDLADLNEALPIGQGQTISQPLVVAFMLELLEPKQEEKILDIGSGSGYTSCLLSSIVGEKGRVVAVEVVGELKNFGEENARKYSFIKKGILQFINSDGNNGYLKEAPYDKILCSASLQDRDIPQAWKEQLKVGGRIVTPIGNSIWLFVKKSDKEFYSEEYPGFVFVPMVS